MKKHLILLLFSIFALAPITTGAMQALSLPKTELSIKPKPNKENKNDKLNSTIFSIGSITCSLLSLLYSGLAAVLYLSLGLVFLGLALYFWYRK